MRLDPRERTVIVHAVTRHFGPQARVLLFGSRTDDASRGGDIDLFIDGVAEDARDVHRCRLALLAELHEHLGDQHIDVVVRREPGPTLPIHRAAIASGVPL